MDKVQELLRKINEITNVKDIAYHKVVKGELSPFTKLETNNLSNEDWKKAHGKFHVKIKGDRVLETVINEHKTVCINDIQGTPDTPTEFDHFGIKSIIVLPIIIENEVKDLIVAASINEKAYFSKDIVEKCEELIKEFIQNL